MPLIKDKQVVDLSCGHSVEVLFAVVKYITHDTECVACVRKWCNSKPIKKDKNV